MFENNRRISGVSCFLCCEKEKEFSIPRSSHKTKDTEDIDIVYLLDGLLEIDSSHVQPISLVTRGGY